MILFNAQLEQSMLIADGGPSSTLPEGRGGPVLAGPEAIFIGCRIDADAATRIVVATELPADLRSCFLALDGVLFTPQRIIRLVNVYDDEFFVLRTAGEETPLQVFLSDLEEPDIVCLVVRSEHL
jgi:hypothetical protein